MKITTNMNAMIMCKNDMNDNFNNLNSITYTYLNDTYSINGQN